MTKFIGRHVELVELNQLYQSKEAQLAVIYGRRRVGKSTLVEQFMQNKSALHFEGLEGVRTKGQIEQFTSDLGRQLKDDLLSHVTFDAWSSVFDYLTSYFSQQKEKTVFFLDEFQWLAVSQSGLVSLIKKYWDQHWKKQNVLLILCGSVSSYMIKKVIQSKALYGRINWELCLQPLNLYEIHQLLGKKRSLDEVLQYALLMGGIPKYLNEINTNASFEQNVNKLFFTETGIFINEYEKIFYSQFKQYKTYENIVNFIRDAPKNLSDISNKLKLASGGGVKAYLDNLEKSLIISQYIPFEKNTNSKLKKYKLTDEYLRFYFKYIAPSKKLISQNRKRNLFTQLVKPTWSAWLGYAFENFCQKNALFLAEVMGFGDYVVEWGPLFHRHDKGFQIDLLYKRSDNVITLCEIKYHDKPIGVKIIPEVNGKCELLKVPQGFTLEKALISRHGADQSVKDLDYFSHIVQIEDLFKEDS